MDWSNCAGAWQNALDALPKTNLSAAELKQQQQYTASLNIAKGRDEKASATRAKVVYLHTGSETAPWEVAADMIPGLHAAGSAGYASSVSNGPSFVFLFP
jgi:stress-induced-phosphoprotein 1